MRISAISLSVFRLPGNTGCFDLAEKGPGHARRWVRQGRGSVESDLHVLHVRTDEGIEGIRTVGNARYTAMRPDFPGWGAEWDWFRRQRVAEL